MRVLTLVQIFETHDDNGSDRHYYFCKGISKYGHDSIVITANIDYKNAAKRFGGRSFLTIKKLISGIETYYVPVYSQFRGSFFKRFIFFISFFISATLKSLRINNVDIIYAVSTPITVTLLGSIISYFKRLPLVIEITDVWPDAAEHTGVIKSKIIIKLANLIANFSYKRATKIIALSKGIRDTLILKGVPPEKIEIISNGIDMNLFRGFNSNEIEESKKFYGFNDYFICMYMGAHGKYNALSTILKAAKQLSSIRKIKFVFVGDGDEKNAMKNFVRENELANISFLGTFSRPESVRLLNSADLFLLPNRKGNFFRGNLPNKLFDYMASSKPILVAGDGETPEVVNAAKCGLSVNPEDYDEFSKKIIFFYELKKQERDNIGKNGREYVLENFNRSNHLEAFISILKQSLIK